MKCPRCLVSFHDEVKVIPLGNDVNGGWYINKSTCPNPKCKRDIYVMANGGYVWNNHGGFQLEKPKSLTLIYPKRSYRLPVPKEVPTHIASDFTEACICDGG